MKRVARAAAAVSIVLAGCAGRDPVPISAYKPSDANLSCADLANEIQSNNANMLVRARESADTTDRNVLIGAAGVLLFAPILLAIDAKDAAGTENRSYEERNRYLAGQARQVGCQVPTPMTVAMAEQQVDQAKKANSTDGSPLAADRIGRWMLTMSRPSRIHMPLWPPMIACPATSPSRNVRACCSAGKLWK